MIKNPMAESGHLTIKSLIFDNNQDPDHIALESPGLSPLTYHDLRMQVLYVLKTLCSQGFRRNDRIALVTPAGPETAAMMVAIMAGFTCVPLNPLINRSEFENYLSQLRVKAIVVQPGFAMAAAAAARICHIPVIELAPLPGYAGKFTLSPVPSTDTAAIFAVPSDISHVFLTSGTTSRPKIVPITQQQSVITRYRQVQSLSLTCSDRCLQILPYHNGMGIGIPLLGTLLAGGTVICTRDFIASDFFTLLETCQPTFFIAGPAHLQAILREIRKLPPESLKNNRLRFILSSSALLPPNVHDALEILLGVPVIEQYASSETGVISFNLPPRKGSVGFPVIEHLAILHENGDRAGPFETGEIIVKGETVFSGYENAPEENTASFTGGWFRMGDLGYRDNEGYLYLTGRTKELINKGGEKIAPAEIDAALALHPGVREAMAFSVRDVILGEDIAAMIVCGEAAVTEQDLRLFLLDRLTPAKIPRRFYFVDTIPKNATGKPMRREGTRRYS